MTPVDRQPVNRQDEIRALMLNEHISWHGTAVRLAEMAEELAGQVRDLEAALERVRQQQPKTLEWLRANGIVFDGPLGTDPSNWQHVAFSICSDLCEVYSIARAALAPAEEPPKKPAALRFCTGCGGWSDTGTDCPRCSPAAPAEER